MTLSQMQALLGARDEAKERRVFRAFSLRDSQNLAFRSLYTPEISHVATQSSHCTLAPLTITATSRIDNHEPLTSLQTRSTPAASTNICLSAPASTSPYPASSNTSLNTSRISVF